MNPGVLQMNHLMKKAILRISSTISPVGKKFSMWCQYKLLRIRFDQIQIQIDCLNMHMARLDSGRLSDIAGYNF